MAVTFVCPICKGALHVTPQAYACSPCGRTYPVLCGIPDFRLEPDPYISMEGDRTKGAELHEIAASATFEQMLHRYYAMTPEVPPALAERWIAHANAGVEIAGAFLKDSGLLTGERPQPRPRPHLDLGCSTGALLIAAGPTRRPLVGIDVAFRWLVIGQARLREAGAAATLVCANAEHLPFSAESFEIVTCTDVLEHVRDAGAALQQAFRVSAPGAMFAGETNNRYTLLPEPHVGLWGVGWLPRRWQAAYVAAHRPNKHSYRIHLRSAWELGRLARDAGYRHVRIHAARLSAPHLTRSARRLIPLYNSLRAAPVIAQSLKMAGPRLRVRAERPLAQAPMSATASHEPWPATTAQADR